MDASMDGTAELAEFYTTDQPSSRAVCFEPYFAYPIPMRARSFFTVPIGDGRRCEGFWYGYDSLQLILALHVQELFFLQLVDFFNLRVL